MRIRIAALTSVCAVLLGAAAPGPAAPVFVREVTTEEIVVRPSGAEPKDAFANFAEPTTGTGFWIVAALPTTREQHQKVFRKRSPSNATLTAYAGLWRTLSREGGDSLLATGSGPGASESGLLGWIRARQGTVVLIGHNEGGKLALTSGARADLGAIASTCLEAGVRCVVLACRSDEHLNGGAVGTKDDLTFSDAVKSSRVLRDFTRGEREANRPITLAGLRATLVDSLGEKMCHSHVNYAAHRRENKLLIGAIVVGGVAGATILERENEKE